jgi:hypothetical protein
VSRNRLQGNGSAWEETKGAQEVVSRNREKETETQAGNQRELVRPREPGSLACNETAFSQAGKQAARQTHSEAGTQAVAGWQKQGGRQRHRGGQRQPEGCRQTSRGHRGRQAKPEAKLPDDGCV